MTFNPKAAIAATVATVCILTGTMGLAQSLKAPQARYVAETAPSAPSAG